MPTDTTKEKADGCYTALILLAVALIVLGVGYLFNPGIALVSVGVALFWRLVHVRRAEKAKQAQAEG